ncbi:hypothetical protein B0H16DRAFT_1883194 [Mycena metata]|uniref:Uncharacterized protein n=1 Tax=Mycena metata TaxID=1033252 RepID=A0AAD7NL54_9AGAR|nr:hypothetical protein B0H16DRAFT_1883194 [Mycena metata]
MGLFNDDDDYKRHEEAWRTVEEARLHPEHHKAKLSHELIAGAASFAAAKMYEHHLEKEGKPVDHAGAKALLAGFADQVMLYSQADAWEGHKNKQELKREYQEHAAHHLEREYTEEAHQQWNAEHDHWHANGGLQAYVPPPAGYEVGYMPYYPAQGGGYPALVGYPPQYQSPMGYAPPAMGYAPPPMGYAPPPMGYAPPAMGYAPPMGEFERPHHHHGLDRREERAERREERRERREERREEKWERREERRVGSLSPGITHY